MIVSNAPSTSKHRELDAAHWPGRDAEPNPRQRIEQAVRMILEAIGEDVDREGLKDTPKRVAKAYLEMFRGLNEDPGVHLARTFTQDSDDLILLRDIQFSSMCEHHLLPFTGRAHVAYLPADGTVLGLSKLARVVDTFARRPQLQERLTNQVADALETYAKPRGVAVIVEGEHMCMKLRGANKQGSVMRTSAYRGVFRDDPMWRTELTTILASPSGLMSPAGRQDAGCCDHGLLGDHA